jgi:hypothetical protein
MPPNVWLGVSMTNQADSDLRIPILLSAQASVHFVSAEPLLGPLDLSSWIGYNPMYENKYADGKSGHGCDSSGGFGGGFERKDMEAQKESMVNVGKKGGRSSMPSGKGRKQDRSRLSSSPNNVESYSSQCRSASDCLSDACRTYSGRNVGQSQERDQGRQSTLEPGISDPKTKCHSRTEDFKGRAIRPEWGEKQYAQIVPGSGTGHPPISGKISRRSKDPTGPRCVHVDEKIRSFPADDIAGSKTKVLGLDLIILGRLTGYGKKNDPPIEALSDVYDYCHYHDIPLFMKSNLAGIWPGPLIQEFPKVTP